jgi:hypothetical protein
VGSRELRLGNDLTTESSGGDAFLGDVSNCRTASSSTFAYARTTVLTSGFELASFPAKVRGEWGRSVPRQAPGREVAALAVRDTGSSHPRQGSASSS